MGYSGSLRAGFGGYMKTIRYVVSLFGLMFLLLLSIDVMAAPKAKMIPFWNDYEPDSGLKMNHDAWDALLKKYVVTGHPSGVNRFRYDDVTPEDQTSLQVYIEYLQRMDPRQLNHARKKAYWMNFYNAAIVLIVLTEQPEESIRDVSNLWRKKRFEVTRQKVSLDDIEHGVIRPFYKDPRVHFGFTPATVGSGNILPVAFTHENIEELLERNTRDFLNESGRGVFIDGNTLRISTLFRWYKDDFGSKKGNIKAFIKKYVSPDVARQIDQTTRISYEYNWELNKP